MTINPSLHVTARVALPPILLCLLLAISVRAAPTISLWDEAEKRLASGGEVLFVPRNSDLNWTSPPLDTVPVFWNRFMGPAWGRMLGLWIDTGSKGQRCRFDRFKRNKSASSDIDEGPD